MDSPFDTPIAIFAGAGTGKTTALIARILNMVARGIQPGVLQHLLVKPCTTYGLRHATEGVSDYDHQFAVCANKVSLCHLEM